MTLADEPQGMQGRIAARFARADEERMRELDAAIARGGRAEVDRKLCPCGCLAPLGKCEEKRRRQAVVAEGAPIERVMAEAIRDLSAPSAPAPKPVTLPAAWREATGEKPDGLPGGARGSTARLEVPRLTSAASTVMTDRTCRCGCGRKLRKNNASGWSGYCNPARYASGERPSRRKEENMRTCGNCGSKDHDRRTCPKGKPSPATKVPPVPKLERKPRAAVRVVELSTEDLLERRQELLQEVADIEQQLRVRLANEEDRLRRMREAVAGLEREAKAVGE